MGIFDRLDHLLCLTMTRGTSICTRWLSLQDHGKAQVNPNNWCKHNIFTALTQPLTPQNPRYNCEISLITSVPYKNVLTYCIFYFVRDNCKRVLHINRRKGRNTPAVPRRWQTSCSPTIKLWWIYHGDAKVTGETHSRTVSHWGN